ncbi:MAG: hypothetical protein EZS28_032411 [Streblomastix strix]|uniref:PUL domain-containing protein n=1 Tax=Streblomastix strix TaxID=222440 RepID=A0A5J4UNY9_9EUKA|nr:MAG: hypothetical protein EZS28_032411 [Streblomastix strix]
MDNIVDRINNTESDKLAYLLKNKGREMSMIINALSGLSYLAGHQDTANHAEMMCSSCILIVMDALSDPTGTKATIPDGVLQNVLFLLAELFALGTLNTRDAIKGQSSREFVRALTQNQNSKVAKNAEDLLNKLNK